MKYKRYGRSYQTKVEDTAKGYFGLAIIVGLVIAIVKAAIWLYEVLVH